MQICFLAATLFQAESWPVGSNSLFRHFLLLQNRLRSPLTYLWASFRNLSIDSDVFAKQRHRLAGFQYSNVFYVRYRKNCGILSRQIPDLLLQHVRILTETLLRM